LSDYEKLRFRVLFDVWFPGQEEVMMSSLLCRGCGFVCYSPRPEEKDLEAKYRFLNATGTDNGQTSYESSIETDRAQRLFHYLRRFLNGPSEIMDFGGGDGHLMRGFIEAGHSCYLLDYGRRVVPGVEKLGDTLTDLPVDRKFDLIVCNHVLEHLAEPLGTLLKLREFIRDGGLMFVEVPMEIWRQAPLHNEPVTHVNFFVPGSLRACLQLAGFFVNYCTLSAYLNSDGRILPAVRAVALKASQTYSTLCEKSSWSGVVEVNKYLKPTFTTRIQRMLVMRENFGGSIAYQFSRTTRKMVHR
jgi:SAM-dependent methyltransferase